VLAKQYTKAFTLQQPLSILSTTKMADPSALESYNGHKASFLSMTS